MTAALKMPYRRLGDLAPSTGARWKAGLESASKSDSQSPNTPIICS